MRAPDPSNAAPSPTPLSDASEAWVRRTAEELAALPSPEALQAWLEAHGGQRFLRATLHQLGQLTQQPTWSVQPVYAAFARSWARQEVVGLLSHALLELELARAWQKEREGLWAKPPDAPELMPAWELLQERLQGHTPVLLAAERAVRVELDPPSLEHSFSHKVLELAPPRCDAADPRALAAFLDALTGPTEVAGSPTPKGELLAALRVPQSHRDLAALVEALAPPPVLDRAHETAWLVHIDDHLSVRPARCRTRKSGGGFVVHPLPASPAAGELPPLSAADALALAHVTHSARLDALVGHPRVFVAQGGERDREPRQVRRGQVGLHLAPVAPKDTEPRERSSGEARVLLHLDGTPIEPTALQRPYRVDNAWVVAVQKGAVVLARLPRAVSQVAELLSERGELVVPSGAHLLGALPTLQEHVAVSAEPGVLGPPVPPDLRPRLRLHATPHDVFVEARVQPLPEAPSQIPGAGSPILVGERDGALVHTRRQLASEPSTVEQALASLPLPAAGRDGFRWRIPDLQQALELVHLARDPALGVQVSWRGDRLHPRGEELTPERLSLTIGRNRGWFDVDGEIDVEGVRIGLDVLLRAARDAHRWVPLGTRQWARMSDELMARLRVLAAATPEGEQRLWSVHAPTVQALADGGATVEAPVDWHAMAAAQLESVTVPVEVPEGLQASLRPYQEDGFRWLARLARWAPGACLADDMGLGKTIQAIALLLHRSQGAALVVAPTSLLTNWERELERFAPGLVVRRYHGTSRELVAAPGSVSLTTYGVLTQDAAVLQEHPFATVVLDEAQAIKNPTAQRARAAQGLQAGFRLALTGTPVENRTEELWSLFRFVSPGLLGAAVDFRRRFARPIEAHGDQAQRGLLAQLVGPFLLRRTKEVVADELPPRTDIEHRVVLTGAEQSLYERARLEAKQRIARAAKDAHSFTVLTELQRLRQLACHPRLDDPGSLVPSSKLAATRRIVAELRASGHRALLFSSFVQHLALVREALQADGVSLRYLDGSMAPEARLREVDAFQAGEGDVFLISLLAGGTGLNLTGATYVLHLDPWWNPAVEDQASDRAHRIGQTDPVTVVRLIAEGTLEERIVELHAEKRELARGLLAGAGTLDQRLPVDALLDLLEP